MWKGCAVVRARTYRVGILSASRLHARHGVWELVACARIILATDHMPESTGSIHRLVREIRPARCCTAHRDEWIVCSCGWEHNGGVDGDTITDAVFGHRLTVVEYIIGIKIEFLKGE